MTGPSDTISAAAGAGTLQYGLGLVNQIGAYHAQKALLRNQYSEWNKQLARVGATPSAIAEGLTKAGPSGSPGVSAGAPVPEFGSNSIAARDIASQQSLRESEERLNLLELTWRPKRYFADVERTWSEVGKNWSQSDLNKGLKRYYDELEKDIRLKRPWEIAKIQRGLQVELARYNEIMQSIEESKSRQRFNEANTFKAWNEGFNESLKSFQLHFDNFLLANGWDPRSNAWENVKRISLTDPEAFRTLLGRVNESLGIIDGKLKSDLGEHYKRNIAIAGGLYGLNNMIGRSKDARFRRLNMLTGAIGNLIPLAGLSSQPPMGFNSIGGRYVYDPVNSHGFFVH